MTQRSLCLLKRKEIHFDTEVSIEISYYLEIIEVERQQGQWSAAPFGPLDLDMDAHDELAPIPDTGP